MPAILRHSNLIETGAELIEFTSFFVLVCMALCFHPVSLDEDGEELPRDRWSMDEKCNPCISDSVDNVSMYDFTAKS
ncbi:unnamed protein product [Musa banksii]